MALTESTMLDLGTAAPNFALTDVVSGQTVRRSDFLGGKGLLVMFLCTHCPFVKHIEESVARLGADYAGKLGIVGISSNDAEQYPDDGPLGLKEQALRLGFRFPYLYDEDQAVARAYRAACTPDIYLFEENLSLVYRGQFDSSRPGNGIPVTGQDLRRAIDLVLRSEKPDPAQQASVGCNIKWKGAR